jgi:hypothetical protein
MRLRFHTYPVSIILGVALLAMLWQDRLDAQIQSITIPDETERNESRTFTAYDVHDEITEHTRQRWIEPGAWSNFRKHIFTREDEGYNVIETVQYWADGSWRNATREIVTYDSNRNKTSQTREQWVDPDGWTPEVRDIFTYDQENRRNEWREQLRSDDGNWYNNWRFTYSYDEAGNVTEESFQEWVSNRWTVSNRVVHQYDNEGNRTERVFYTARRRSVEPDIMNRYEYGDGTGMTRQLRRTWTGNAWLDVTVEEYEYNENDLLSVIQYADVQGGGAQLITARDSLSYDEEGRLIARLRQERSPGGRFVNVSQHRYTYDFRGFRSTASMLVWRDERWVEVERTSYTYDVNGNQTSSLTQR